MFVLPESMKDRDFKVGFSEYIEDIHQAFAIDMNEVVLNPLTGTEALLVPYDGVRIRNIRTIRSK